MSSPITRLYKNLIRHLYRKAFPQQYQTTRYGVINIKGFGDNFKEFQMYNNMLEAVETLKQGLSDQDKKLLIKSMNNLSFYL